MKEFTLTRPQIKICVDSISPNLKKMLGSITEAMKMSDLLRLFEAEQAKSEGYVKILDEKIQASETYLKSDKKSFTDEGAKYYNEEMEKIVTEEVVFKFDVFPKEMINNCPVEMIDAIRILEQKIFE